MQVSVTFTGTQEQINEVVRKVNGDEASEATATASATPTPMLTRAGISKEVDADEAVEEKQKRHRRTKAEMEAARAPAPKPAKKKAAPVVEEDDEETEAADETADVEYDADLDDEPVAAKSKLTLEGDIIPAFQAYAKKYSREKAGAVLSKLGVRAVREIPVEAYPAVLATLRL